MPPDPYQVMLRKARQDAELAAKLMADAEVPDEHIGFWCQQAVEKSIKSVLSVRGVRYRRTHDLSELVNVARIAGIEVPEAVAIGVMLTPFAVEFRYDDLPDEEDESDFQRAQAVGIAAAAVAWARKLVEGGG